MFKKIVVLGVVFFGLNAASFAAVNVEKRTGNVRVTNPKTAPVDVAADASLPTIADAGAVLEVVSGTALVSATGASEVTVIVAGKSYVVKAGWALDVSFSTEGVPQVQEIKNDVEGYQAPKIDDPVAIDENVKTEEATRDISPISQ